MSNAILCSEAGTVTLEALSSKILTQPESMNNPDQYTPRSETNLGPGEWLAMEKERLDRLGLRSGQRFIFHFERDPREDWFENLGRFEVPA